jgi:hypothetical protein
MKIFIKPEHEQFIESQIKSGTVEKKQQGNQEDEQI